MSTPNLYAFSVRHKDHETVDVVNHRSRGGAIAECLRDWQDAWPDVRFTDLRARKLGEPITSARLLRVAAYRGKPWVRAGMRVSIEGGRTGAIVDGNDSENFDVLIDGGHIVNCHPADLTFHERPTT